MFEMLLQEQDHAFSDITVISDLIF